MSARLPGFGAIEMTVRVRAGLRGELLDWHRGAERHAARDRG